MDYKIIDSELDRLRREWPSHDFWADRLATEGVLWCAQPRNDSEDIPPDVPRYEIRAESVASLERQLSEQSGQADDGG